MPLILFFCVLVTTQETLYALIGLSGGALFLMRALADGFAIVALIFYILRFTLQGRPTPLTGLRFEWLFLPFLIYSVLISLAVTGSNLFLNLSEILVLNRFVFLAIAIPFIVNTPEKIEKVLRVIWVLILVQAALGVLQFLGGPNVIALFAPSDYSNFLADVERSFTSNRELERNFLIGSMGDFLSYGYTLLFGMVMIITGKARGWRSGALLLLLCFLLFQSGSRTIFLVSVLLLVHYFFNNRPLVVRVALLLVALPAVPVAFFFLTVAANTVSSSSDFTYGSFISLLDSRIIENLMNQRLGLAIGYIPSLLMDPVVLTGMSPDRTLVADYARDQFTHLPYPLLYAFDSLVEDFYIAAVLSYYGLFGALLFYGMHLRLFKQAVLGRRSPDPQVARMGGLALYALLAMNLLSFANQSYENRGLAFFTWVTIGLFASAVQIAYRRRGLTLGPTPEAPVPAGMKTA